MYFDMNLLRGKQCNIESVNNYFFVRMVEWKIFIKDGETFLLVAEVLNLKCYQHLTF